MVIFFDFKKQNRCAYANAISPLPSWIIYYKLSLLQLLTNTHHHITIINSRPFYHQRAFFIYFLRGGGVVVGRYNLSVMVHARSFITIYHSSSSSVGSTRPGTAIYIAVSARLSVSAVTDSFPISSFSSAAAAVNCDASTTNCRAPPIE